MQLNRSAKRFWDKEKETIQISLMGGELGEVWVNGSYY